MKQGHEKGSAFAICTTTFQKADKPIYVGESESQKLHLFSESVRLEGNRVSGVAIHPKRIFHPEEDTTHVYLREELEKAAPTLVGKPFGIDHLYVLPPPNVITNAWYDPKENGVAFEGTVDDSIAEQIRSRAFKGLSIELNWLRPGGKVEYMDGIGPRNFELTSVHLLKRFPPGDRDAFIKLWNGIMEQLVVGPAKPLDQTVAELQQSFDSFRNFVEQRFAKIEGQLSALIPSAIGESAQSARSEPSQTIGVETMNEAELKKLVEAQVKAILKEQEGDERQQFMGQCMKDGKSMEECAKEWDAKQAPAKPPQATMQEAEWDTAFINDLPDSAFAVISKGGEKDEQGKTVPRSLRHLPHHNAQGGLDLPHLRNALARLPQTDLSADDRAEAKRHLCAHAKESEIVSDVCGEEPSKQQQEALKESEQLVALRKQVVDLEAKLAESDKALKQQTESLQKKYADFRKLIESTIPPSHIWRAWTPGPQKLIQAQLKVLRES